MVSNKRDYIQNNNIITVDIYKIKNSSSLIVNKDIKQLTNVSEG